MKLYLIDLLLLITFCQLSCKTSQNKRFTQTTKNSHITLRNVSEPYIAFVLETSDTIRFSKQDVYLILSSWLKKEIVKLGYISSKDFAALAKTLRETLTDTTVYQNLSAVTNK